MINTKFSLMVTFLWKADRLEKAHIDVPIHNGNGLVLKLCGEFMGVYFHIMLHKLIILYVFFSVRYYSQCFFKDLGINYLELLYLNKYSFLCLFFLSYKGDAVLELGN